jgi:hypothetical protein
MGYKIKKVKRVWSVRIVWLVRSVERIGRAQS